MFLICFFPEKIINLIGYENFILPKVFVGLNFAIFIDDIVVFLKRLTIETPQKFKSLVSSVSKNKISDTNNQTLYGIQLENIVAFLVEHGGWKTMEFHKSFGKKNNLFKKIGDLLETRGILERGDKNQRILKPGLSVENIIDKIHSPLEKQTENYYNYIG